MKKILRKMLLGGLMVCAGGIMHAAAAEPNFFAIAESNFNDMSLDERNRCIDSVTPEEFDSRSPEEQMRYVDFLIKHEDGDERKALKYASNRGLEGVSYELMLRLGKRLGDGFEDCPEAEGGFLAFGDSNCGAQRKTVVYEWQVLTCKEEQGAVVCETSCKNEVGDDQIPVSESMPDNHMFEQPVADGVDLNAVDLNGEMSLHRAASEGNEGMVSLLLKKRAKINSINVTGQTALHIAAYNGHERIVRLLVENGADEDVVDIYGFTAMYEAIDRGHVSIAKFLSDSRRDKSNSSQAELFVAAETGVEEMVAILLKNGVDVGSVDRNGLTALYYAARNGHEGVVRLLLQAGAKTEVVDHNDLTPLWQAACNGHERVVKLLLRAGAKTEVVDCRGFTPIYHAIRSGYKGVVGLLLQAGASAEVVDYNGFAPIYHAAFCGSAGAVEALVALAAVDITKPCRIRRQNGLDDIDVTVLDVAIEYGHIDCVQLLIGMFRSQFRCEYPKSEQVDSADSSVNLFDCAIGVRRNTMKHLSYSKWERARLLELQLKRSLARLKKIKLSFSMKMERLLETELSALRLELQEAQESGVACVELPCGADAPCANLGMQDFLELQVLDGTGIGQFPVRDDFFIDEGIEVRRDRIEADKKLRVKENLSADFSGNFGQACANAVGLDDGGVSLLYDDIQAGPAQSIADQQLRAEQNEEYQLGLDEDQRKARLKADSQAGPAPRLVAAEVLAASNIALGVAMPNEQGRAAAVAVAEQDGAAAQADEEPELTREQRREMMARAYEARQNERNK